MKIDKKQIWMACVALGPLFAYLAVFYHPLILISAIFMIIAIKGVIVDIM